MSEDWPIAVFEVLAFVLALAVFATRLLRLERRSRSIQAAVFALLIVVALIPIDKLNGSQHFLTIAGHLSFTSMCLLGAFIVGKFSGSVLWKRGEKQLMLPAVLVCGILIYLAAFGVVTFDLYQLGYSSVSLIAALTVAAVAAAVARFNILFSVLVSAAAGFQLHLLHSHNIWDYLVDPLLVIYAAASLSIAAVGSIKRGRPELSDIR